MGVELINLNWSINFLHNPNALRLTIGLNQTQNDIIDCFIKDVIKSCNKILEKVALDSNLNKKNLKTVKKIFFYY